MGGALGVGVGAAVGGLIVHLERNWSDILVNVRGGRMCRADGRAGRTDVWGGRKCWTDGCGGRRDVLV